MSKAAKSLASRNWQSRKRGSNLKLTLVLAFVATSAMLSFLLLKADPTPIDTNPPAEIIAKPSWGEVVTASSSLALASEKRYADTVKECTNHKCKQHLADQNNPNRQRVAFITTGNEASRKLFEILKKGILIYYGNDQKTMDEEIELVYTHHVPPYGYGKSHGWTKIVRIFQPPLITESFEALGNRALVSSDPNASISLSQSMRQVIRFHCRLSHVAEHTFMYNVDLSSKYLQNRVSKTVALVTAKKGESSTGNFRQSDRMKKVDAYLKEALSFPLSNAPLELKKIVGKKELKELDSVLLDELDSTQDLSSWPCKSLWDLDGLAMDASDNAKRFSPDCDAPFTSCFVKKDLCEMKGDAACVN